MYKRITIARLVLVVLIAVMVLAACQSPAVDTPTPTPAPTETPVTGAPYVLEGAVTTESGLQYLELTAGEGSSPEVGDIITVHYIVTLPDGTEIANSYMEPSPPATVWGVGRLLPGWEEAIGLMNVGDKARVVIPPGLAFGEQGNGMIPPNTPIIIEMELLSVEPAPAPAMVSADQLTATGSGLEYYDLEVGTGAVAEPRSGVSTHYKLWVRTDNGYEFVSQSLDDQPLDFVLGRGDTVFPGWEEGAAGMRVGGKRLLVVPPSLGLGMQGGGVIPPNSILVMEIELAEVRQPRSATDVDEADYVTTESGLKYFDLQPGTGATPQAGQMVVVHYTGWLEDGTEFDSSLENGQPFTFVLDQGNVISGWDEGVSTMQVGGKRQLVIPADLAYGEAGAGGVIPPNATLIFEVELLDIVQ
jgi:peptidylprolyl isomerase